MAAETDFRALPEVDDDDDVDVAAAVALLEKVAESAGADGEADYATASDASPDDSPDDGTAGEPDDAEAQPADVEADDDKAGEQAPEFWSPEDKALWERVPTELRPMLRKYETQRIAFVNEKLREAARAREEAGQAAREATEVVERAALWWHQNGPTLHQAVADKWAQVDWDRLAEENPAEWTRLRRQRDQEAAVVQEADRRGKADIERTRERTRQAIEAARQAEHDKLATRLPQFFGPDRAAETYQALGRFLHAKGIPPERINTIHEAPIIELALAAMRFEEAQKQASTATRGPTNSTVRTTPTRVAPGPASRAGNRSADSIRQVGERFRQGGGASIADAAELIRLSGL